MITKRSKIREIAEIPGIADIIKEKTGKSLSEETFNMFGAMNLLTAARSMGWPDETLDDLIETVNSRLQ